MSDDPSMSEILRNRHKRVAFGQTGFYHKGDADFDAAVADRIEALEAERDELVAGLRQVLIAPYQERNDQAYFDGRKRIEDEVRALLTKHTTRPTDAPGDGS